MDNIATMIPYKDFIKPLNKVLFYPISNDWNWDVEPQIVEISEHSPYYRDGSPDPKLDELDDASYVEIVGSVRGESQICLKDLFPIDANEEYDVVYNGKAYKQVGKNEEYKKAILVVDDDEWIAVDDDYVMPKRSVQDLSREELYQLFNRCVVGSIYIDDYYNDLGITMQEACDTIDAFCESVHWDDDKLRPNCFADYILD